MARSVAAVAVVPEDGTAFEAPPHDVAEDTGGIEAGAAGHGERLASAGRAVKR